MTRIVALVDNSLYADSVCDHAAWLAEARAATIDVVHIVSPFDPAAIRASMAGLSVGGPGLVGSNARHSEERLGELIAEAQKLVDRITGRLAKSQAGIVLGRVVIGDIYEVAKQLDAEADVLVAGKRGETADFVNLTLGTNLERIIHSTRKPLLIAPRNFRPISSWVLAFGRGPEIAAGLRAVSERQILPPIPCEIIYAGDADKETQREIEEVRAYLLDRGFPATIDIANGRPVSTITRRMVADEIRMIAIGGFTRLRLFPAIFGEGVASELTKATLAAVFLLR